MTLSLLLCAERPFTLAVRLHQYATCGPCAAMETASVQMIGPEGAALYVDDAARCVCDLDRHTDVSLGCRVAALCKPSCVAGPQLCGA